MKQSNKIDISNNDSISIKAVGDICPGDYSILGSGICTLIKKNGTSFPFSNIPNVFNGSDIVIGNLEGVLSRKIDKRKIPDITFCGISEFSYELRRQGFNIINVANNHIMEHGPEVFNETIELLRDAGLAICGLRGSGDYYSEPVIMEKKEKRVGILAYNWVGKDKFPDTDKYIAQSHDSIVNYTWDRKQNYTGDIKNNVSDRNKRVINDIAMLKKTVDYTILLAHWGYEFVHEPPNGVILEARSFIDAGADLIIGGHPHVLQGMEKYKEKWIFYSLGNFIFDMRFKKSKTTSILDYKINSSSQDHFQMKYYMANHSFQPSLAKIKDADMIGKIIKSSSEKITSSKKTTVLNDDQVYKKYEKEYNRRKFINISYHFLLMYKNPVIIKTIFIKFKNLFKFFLLRLKGNKVRW